MISKPIMIKSKYISMSKSLAESPCNPILNLVLTVETNIVKNFLTSNTSINRND